MKLRKKVHIVLFLIMVVVLVFYAISRLEIKMPSTIVGDQYCIGEECQVNTTTTTIFGTTQTTGGEPGTPEGSSPPGGPGDSSPTEEPTPPEEPTPSDGTPVTETTTTILYMGCSTNNCEACENSTICYSVGCIWCKVSNRCLIICKG